MSDGTKICFRCMTPVEEAVLVNGLHPACFTTWFKADPSQRFSSLQPKSVKSKDLPGEAGGTKSHNTSFFHGKFRKYSAELGNSSYIFKMREAEAPELPEVEYLCNQLAVLAGLPVAEHYYIEFYGEHIFVTKNFISKTGSRSDLSHIYHYCDLSDSRHFNCENLIQAISQQTKRPYDIEVFIHTCLFDSLIGNNDRHGRNLGFVVTASKISLSPIYDNVSYLALIKGELLKASFSPRGKIFTAGSNEPTMTDYIQEFKRLGYAEEVIKFRERTKIVKVLNAIDISLCSPLMKNALKTLIQERYTELTNEIRTK